jgi:uncharacterized protein YfiM (DUF2279 family)
MTNTRKLLATLILSASPILSHAQSDWTGVDKVWHFSSCATISAAVTIATESEVAGISTCLALGALKEAYSINKYGWTDNWQDMFYNALGGYVGAKLGSNFTLAPTQNGGFKLTWKKEL